MDQIVSELAKALLAAQEDMPPIEKDAVNPHFRSMYTSLDHLLAKTLPVLRKHGLLLTQAPATTAMGDPGLVTRIDHVESGESWEYSMPLAMAKEGPQEQGSCLTYARRYAISALLCVSTDTDDDGNQATAPPSVGDERQPAAAPSSPVAAGAGGAALPADLSPAASLPLGFGKHKELSLIELAQTDRGYLHWIAESMEARKDSDLVLKADARILLGGPAEPTPDPDAEDLPF